MAYKSIAMLLICGTAVVAHAQDDLAKRASWTQPSAAEVKSQTLTWTESQNVDEATQQEIDARWSDEALSKTGDSLLEQVAVTLAFVDPEIRPIVELCRGVAPHRLSLPVEVLFDESRDAFERNNLRLYYGQWLSQHAFYDEALEQLDGLTHDDVVDPASLLFHQSVVHHRLLNKDGCLISLNLLLENEKDIPRRYLSVAKLMEADIKPLEKDSLDEVSRLMDDIQRRLNFGRAGTRVRDEEEDVITKLDKMIEDLEKKRQQAQQASGTANGTLQPSKPAEDSNAMGGTGPGNVDQKRLKNEATWGNLPPKERQEALQQISKDLPAHFRDVIEEYFRKLARDGGN
ncbi:MAG: hypothetical protein H6821_00500 [Planctomycetaceae bacterium]|nr:hypothetical protein [Planctomycetaceae bacterium]